MRTKGKITSWNDEKGYGFIQPLDGSQRVFIHISAFGNKYRRPEDNQVVSYALSTDKQGRPCAINATLAGDRLIEKKARQASSFHLIFAMLFLLVVAIAVATTKLPLHLLGYYLLASLLTFAFYAMDKSAARNDEWRVSEQTLHILSMLGGWPGALLAQQKLRHKSRKTSFRIVLWLTVIVNIAAFSWTLTPEGTDKVQSLIQKLG